MVTGDRAEVRVSTMSLDLDDANCRWEDRLIALLEKTSDADVRRQTIGFVAGRMVALEVGGLIGADYGEKNTDRLAQRIG